MKKTEEIFADYLEGKLSDQDLLEFYEENPGAKEEFEELKQLFLDLPKNSINVSKRADQNFYKHLHQYSEKQDRFKLWDMLKYAAVLVLVSGAYFLGKTQQTEPEVITLKKQVDVEKPVYITKTDTVRIVERIKIAPKITETGEIHKQSKTSQDDISEIRQQLSEINAIQNRMILAMIRQESASGRIQAINESQNLDQIDPVLVSALFEALENDPNANVRLAAVDAIGRLNFTTSLRENLVSALRSQTDPSVQLELINQLIESKEIKALPVFADIINNPETAEAIRDRAELGMNILTQY